MDKPNGSHVRINVRLAGKRTTMMFLDVELQAIDRICKERDCGRDEFIRRSISEYRGDNIGNTGKVRYAICNLLLDKLQKYFRHSFGGTVNSVDDRRENNRV